jgi:hypothetical protein
MSSPPDVSTQRHLTGRRLGHFVTCRCPLRLADDFRFSELDAGEKLLQRAFRHVMAAVLAGTLPQRLIENDICVACRAEFKRGIEHWVTPLLRVDDPFRAGLEERESGT